jgi:hypothetical protein
MLRSKIRTLLALGLPAASILASAPALAQETDSAQAPPGDAPSAFDSSFTFVDFVGSVGYSTNPYLSLEDDEGSPLARVSANAVHNIVGERGTTTLSAFAEQAFYFGSDQEDSRVFSVNASTNQAVSERVRVFGTASFSLDEGGQLSNRFTAAPLAPIGPGELAPPPVLVDEPDLFAITQRQYRLSTQVGASIRTSERGTLTLSAGGQRQWYATDFLDDFTTLFGSGAYDFQVSERTAVGGRVNVQRTSYDDDAGKTLVVNPELTVRTRISEVWDAYLAGGLVFSKVDRGFEGEDDDWSTNFSLSGSLCRQSEFERVCANVSRLAQNSAVVDVATTTTAALSWSRRLDADATLQISGAIIRYETDTIADEEFTTTQFTAGANYDRRISGRLFAGVSASARKLTQNGTDPDADLSGSVYLRYRLGDLL